MKTITRRATKEPGIMSRELQDRAERAARERKEARRAAFSRKPQARVVKPGLARGLLV